MRKFLSLLLIISLVACCSVATSRGEDNADLYENAIGLLKENKYAEAGEAFAALGSYSDSPRYTMYCNAIDAGEAGLYSIAVDNLKSLSGYLDSNLLATYYAGLSWEAAENYEHAIEVLSGISLYRDVTTRIVEYPALINARDYKKADENEKAGTLDAALSAFKALGDYKDSAARAAALQTQINNRDAAAVEQDQSTAYAEADQAEKDKRFEDAYEGFAALGDYSDSKNRAETVRQRARYAKGTSLITIGSYKEAYTVFKALENFEDSEKKAYALGLVDFSDMKQLDETTASFLFHKNTGLINFSDNNVVIPQWDSISFVANNCLKIKNGDLYGLIDRNGNELSPCRWYDFSEANDGILVGVIRNKDESKSTTYSTFYKYAYYLIGINGETLTPSYKSIGQNEPSSDSYASLSAPTFSSGLIRVQSEDSKWGYIDATGEVAIAITYGAASDFANNVAAVKDDRWGYINSSGEFVIEPQFSTAMDFNEHDRAEVKSGTSWHVIDKSGAIVYFKGQPFDEMSADSSDDDFRQQAIEALAKAFAADPEDESFIAYFETMVEEVGGVEQLLGKFDITLE